MVYFDYSSEAGHTLDYLSHSLQSHDYRALNQALERLAVEHLTRWARRKVFNLEDGTPGFLIEVFAGSKTWWILWRYSSRSDLAVIAIEYIGPGPVR